jgi:hypothetical protein
LEITIVGAGMAGLLAGAMLRTEVSEVVEAQEGLPNNHSALLRFRSSVVGDALGIEFKRVSVLKTVAPWRNPVADSLAYAHKCSGIYSLRSSLSAENRLEERFIAPPDLIAQMAARVGAPIRFGTRFDFKSDCRSEPVISTIPMPYLMEALQYPERASIKFSHVSGCNINAEMVGCDAYCTVYVPDPGEAFSRISLTGNKLTVEFPQRKAEWLREIGNGGTQNIFHQLRRAADIFGFNQNYIRNALAFDQHYAKIQPIDDSARKRFMLWATEKHNIYLLGRFATWRPGVLLDDCVKDVRAIRRMIATGHNYEAKL